MSSFSFFLGFLPLIRNADNQVDGGTESDVVEGEENLGEEDGKPMTPDWKRPTEDYKMWLHKYI